MKLPKPFKDPQKCAWDLERHYEQGWNDCLAWVLRNNNGPASVSPHSGALARQLKENGVAKTLMPNGFSD